MSALGETFLLLIGEPSGANGTVAGLRARWVSGHDWTGVQSGSYMYQRPCAWVSRLRWGTCGVAVGFSGQTPFPPPPPASAPAWWEAPWAATSCWWRDCGVVAGVVRRLWWRCVWGVGGGWAARRLPARSQTDDAATRYMRDACPPSSLCYARNPAPCPTVLCIGRCRGRTVTPVTGA